MRIQVILAALATLLMSQAATAEIEGIGWIPTWRQAWAEAAKSHKPILLIAAAPQCAGVPGIW